MLPIFKFFFLLFIWRSYIYLTVIFCDVDPVSRAVEKTQAWVRTFSPRHITQGTPVGARQDRRGLRIVDSPVVVFDDDSIEFGELSMTYSHPRRPRRSIFWIMLATCVSHFLSSELKKSLFSSRVTPQHPLCSASCAHRPEPPINAVLLLAARAACRTYALNNFRSLQVRCSKL